MADFGNLRLKPACVGMLADTSDYNIDGACVVAPGRKAYFGTPVAVIGIVEGVKLVATMQDGEIPYGVAMSTALTSRKVDTGADDYPYAEEGEPISIVSHGRIWCIADEDYAPAPMEKLKIGGGSIKSTASYVSGWSFAGGVVKFGTGANLLEVQVLQNADIVPPPPPPVVLVESATIQSATTSPSVNTDPVNLSVTVLPANADDKTGVWSANAANVATIDPGTGVLTPVGSVGNVNVTWTANDASGVTATYTHRFEAPPAP